MCLCMFHDTLPGSSIRLAVLDYDKEFAKILQTAREMKDSAVRALQSRSANGRAQTAVLNTLPGVERHEMVQMGGGEYKLVTADVGELQGSVTRLDSEQAATGESHRVFRVFELESNDSALAVEKTSKGAVLKNSTMTITIADGRIKSIYDSANASVLKMHKLSEQITMFINRRELLAKDRTAGFKLNEDHPHEGEYAYRSRVAVEDI